MTMLESCHWSFTHFLAFTCRCDLSLAASAEIARLHDDASRLMTARTEVELELESSADGLLRATED